MTEAKREAPRAVRAAIFMLVKEWSAVEAV